MKKLKLNFKETWGKYESALTEYNSEIQASIDAGGERTVRDKIRGNRLEIAKRLLKDFRNAFNEHRYWKEGTWGQGPTVFQEPSGDWWLITSPALCNVTMNKSVSTQTIARNIKHLAKQGKPWSGLIISKMLSNEEFIRNGWGNLSSNDYAIKLNPALLSIYEAKATPKHPPNEKLPHIDGKGLNKADLSKLAKKFNRKHHK